ncbi:hypothetical protein fugu_000056 [Takifugu bimaculatus]|uniref:PDZ GRASP-type domain-containing protein n=1 Tax=Takifugu bimaculatus TaxID=433685 RepID=A0A4Z2CFM1_9TELE|nr:hypothetical protein fugu_000056 [Takifugu bimaculatus]
MGAAPSVEIPGGGQEGYNVLKVRACFREQQVIIVGETAAEDALPAQVHDNSPGHQAGLEPFFDFIISICDTRLVGSQQEDFTRVLPGAVTDWNVFVEQGQRHLDTAVEHERGKTHQDAVIQQQDAGCQGDDRRAQQHEVERDSPAALAGLRAQTDYIIGTDTLMNESDDLFSIVEEYQGKELKLYVYNTETDNCREVLITPNGDWGGDGSLGCSIGYGYLHRVPRLLPGHSRRVRVPSHTSCRTPEGLTEVISAAQHIDTDRI